MPTIKLSKQQHSDLKGLIRVFKEMMITVNMNNSLTKADKKMYSRIIKNAEELENVIEVKYKEEK